MDIDWFTLSAQMVNFIILLLLLKKFLFDRIVQAMDRREREIVSRLDTAERKKAEAADERQEYERRRNELEAKKDQLLAEARKEAARRKREMKESARQEVEDLRSEWRATLQHEKDDFARELRQRTGRQIYAVTRKFLAGLADRDLEQQMIPAFLSRLRGLSDEERATITGAFAENRNRAVVVSSFEIESGQRSRITRTLHDLFDPEMDVGYEQSGDMVCGVELQAGNQIIAWSLSHYLDELEANTLALLARDETSEPEGA